MSDQSVAGVLLRGADGSHYFIPETALSKFTVPGRPVSEDGSVMPADNPSLDAFSVRHTGGRGEPDKFTWLCAE
jgi:hypothetical protein